jgi:uncharacterized membrane protein YhaH (DUF805 family)
MNAFIDSIRSGFTGLVRFSGRDPARRFWPYAGVVIGLVVAGMATVMAPVMNQSFERMQRFAVEHPDQATVTQGPGSYAIEIQGNHPELMPDMTPFFAVLRISVVVAVLLLAAAVTRRLHDRGRRGWWGLPPVVFLVGGLALFPRLFQSMLSGAASPDSMKLFGLMFANNLLYLGSLGLLIFLLAGASQPTANRFGPPAP